MEGALWEVVGGREQGGILVRSGLALGSPAEAERLSTGARLEELELVGERLHFRRLSGTGPERGWVTVKVKEKSLVERVTRAHGAPLLKSFDLLCGPVDLELRPEEEPDASGLPAVLAEYGVTDFQVETVLRTELGRDKFFVSVTTDLGAQFRLFVGQVAEDGPSQAAAEASFAAFAEIGRHCEPKLVSVAEFLQNRNGTFLHGRHLVAPAHGPSDWGRSAKDRRMLAGAIGELHRASAQAFAQGLPEQIERDLVRGEVGLGVLGWGLTVDYADSGLQSWEVGRIQFILSSLLGLDRPDRIRQLPKMVVHTDLQFKNFCRSEASAAPILVDFKLGHFASRIWDLYFILCGDDLSSLLPREDDRKTRDFIEAIQYYEEVSQMPFSDEERFLLMNTIMIKAIFNTCFFGSMVSHLPGSKKKCKAAFDTMEWIIDRKDYFRSVF